MTPQVMEVFQIAIGILSVGLLVAGLRPSVEYNDQGERRPKDGTQPLPPVF
jgi:hypothetical protein